MNNKIMYLGNQKIIHRAKQTQGSLVLLNGEKYYKIEDVDGMRPFLMSIVSSTNQWLFIGSNGGLTAGRKDRDSSLFPYITDDKLIDTTNETGSKTIFHIEKGNKTFLWEPMAHRYEGIYHTTRNLLKSAIGDKIIYEEINHTLELTFQYSWCFSDKYGFVKTVKLFNNTNTKVKITLLDGLQNILPSGVLADMQSTKSNLIDAYKRSELYQNQYLGIYALSAMIVDKAEPSEMLKATTVWSKGLKVENILLSSRQLDSFRLGKLPTSETSVKAEKGAYFVHSEFSLSANGSKEWYIVADVNQTATQIANISNELQSNKELINDLLKDVSKGTKQLKSLVGRADGLQLTSDNLVDIRHFSNTLFNIMRGGIFDNNYQINKKDFCKYIQNANYLLSIDISKVIDNLPSSFNRKELCEIAEKSDNLDFKRLSIEYMPLKFSRRHGDPSRPWNKFSINTKDELTGESILDYEGNWRDIFQNWEALGYSYPEFIESMVFKFLNSSTFDGYNPYRITKDGFEWEVADPEDPWSYIGYWGDHQIIYLLKLLEILEYFYPNKIDSYFDKQLFVYANIPYKIKKYEDIVTNPKDTILFDIDLDKKIVQQKQEKGADGTLLHSKNGQVIKVNFIEKLLATVLAKLSNFIPEAGIWLNTQRPEWNDANNALVGNGTSMVTLYYLNRFLHFFDKVLSNSELLTTSISTELHLFYSKIEDIFLIYNDILQKNVTDEYRKQITDALGKVASDFRWQVYTCGFSEEKETISIERLLSFVRLVNNCLTNTIKKSRRKDGLYHSYNLVSFEKNTISVAHLTEMLEGQVAVLSSGILNEDETLKLLSSMKKSKLFRADQNSYMLYPNKELELFTSKNKIEKKDVLKSELLKMLENDENKSIIEKDANGIYHYHSNFHNSYDVEEALASLPKKYSFLVKKDRKYILNIYENLFNHKEFTGRSGTFYGYEGLGCVYWHMVSKLVLAVGELMQRSNNIEYVEKLNAFYSELKEGIGVHKSPLDYGAIPTDPYSHTPMYKGAQQPGMTGQVKEDVLSKILEMGVSVRNGEIVFDMKMMKYECFLENDEMFSYYSLASKFENILIRKGQLVITLCQLPIIYNLSHKNSISVFYSNGKIDTIDGHHLGKVLSKSIFSRVGHIDKMYVNMKNLFL